VRLALPAQGQQLPVFDCDPAQQPADATDQPVLPVGALLPDTERVNRREVLGELRQPIAAPIAPEVGRQDRPEFVVLENVMPLGVMCVDCPSTKRTTGPS
jgi:hypothetical protein